jgi:hypothetical protein
MRATYEEAYRGRLASFVQTQLASLEEGLVRHPGPLPYWQRFNVDRSGNVWVSEYPFLGQPLSAWRVIRRNGELVGWVGLSGVAATLNVTDDRILAVKRNELHVQAVTMFELSKG